MKRLLQFALIALLFTACNKGADQPISPVSEYISLNYTEDAKTLLFRLLQSGAITTDKDKPEFNKTELDKILHAFQAIYDLKKPHSDSVFNVSKVHVYPYISLRSIILQVNQSTAEAQKILVHQPSGNTGYEALLTKYGYTYTGKSLLFSNSAFVVIKSDTSYNVPPLFAAFKAFPFIIGAENNGAVGDGNDIEYKLSGNGVDIDFAVKGGDCPAGCTIRHGWKYHVTTGYQATYLGRY